MRSVPLPLIASALRFAPLPLKTSALRFATHNSRKVPALCALVLAGPSLINVIAAFLA